MAFARCESSWPTWRAINCTQEGVATPDDIVALLQLGANHPMGPLALADLIGHDIVQRDHGAAVCGLQ